MCSIIYSEMYIIHKLMFTNRQIKMKQEFLLKGPLIHLPFLLLASAQQNGAVWVQRSLEDIQKSRVEEGWGREGIKTR